MTSPRSNITDFVSNRIEDSLVFNERQTQIAID
jgi:hypothetical protein